MTTRVLRDRGDGARDDAPATGRWRGVDAAPARGGGVHTPSEGGPAALTRLHRDLGNRAVQRLEGTDATVSSTLRETLSGGEPLRDSSRTFMEMSLGSNLDRVRVHTDDRAVNMSQSLGAEAFTYGRHIYFNANRYTPETTKGAKLLGHELVHTIQQGFHDDPVPDDISIGSRGDPAEQEAERVSASIVGGRPSAGRAAARSVLHASRIQPMIQASKGLDVAVYETKDHGTGYEDAPDETYKLKANSLKEAGDQLTTLVKVAGDIGLPSSIGQLSFYGHGAPGSQSVGAGEDWDPTKEISVKSIAEQPEADYRRIWSPLANGASVYMRGCQVGAEQKGLALLQEVKSSAKKLANRDIDAYGWTGKSYHHRQLWYDWYEQTGQKASSSDDTPKTTWEKLEQREKNKKK